MHPRLTVYHSCLDSLFAGYLGHDRGRFEWWSWDRNDMSIRSGAGRLELSYCSSLRPGTKVGQANFAMGQQGREGAAPYCRRSGGLTEGATHAALKRGDKARSLGGPCLLGATASCS
jgi:hypothetical protein